MSKEIQEILKRISEFAPGEKAILATVIDLEGSGYRRPGARMLIDENGKSIGTVSGGCLEADVLERAKKVLQTGEPTVITYDTTKDENSLFGLGMGCRGVVRILLEQIEKESEFIEYVSASLNQRTPIKAATLIKTKRNDLKIGARILQDELNFFGAQLSFDEILEIKNLPADAAKVANLSFGEIFVETIKPPPEIQLFGAGYDALPLVKLAKELGWRVTLIDHRAAWANDERFPEADEIVVSRAETLPEELFADGMAVAVVMTHNYEADKKILSRLLSADYQYIGALGPKKRTEKILAELAEDSLNFSPSQLEKLYAPVGLDIGADTPESIALSIVAEIQSVLAGRNGGFLRLRQGGIYNRASN